MKNPKSIILAILSAENQYILQKVLDIAESHDPKRERTLGIITKPDTTKPLSQKEEEWVKCAKNETIKLRLGWYTLRNMERNRGEQNHPSDAARDLEETRFFGIGSWSDVDRDRVGIAALRRGLRSLLQRHTQHHLPSLVEDIQTKINANQAQLDKLGVGRVSTSERKTYLINISRQFEKIVLQATNGNYDDRHFFADGELYANLDSRNLRAVLRALNEAFVEKMQNEGHRRCIVPVDSSTSDDEDDDTNAGSARKQCFFTHTNNKSPDRQETIDRDEFELEVEQEATKARGTELPTAVNRHLPGKLFRDQSRPWMKLATEHLESSWEAVSDFADLLLTHLTDDPTHGYLRNEILDRALETIRTKLELKLKELFFYYERGHTLPTTGRFCEKLKSIQSRRQAGCQHDQDNSTETDPAAPGGARNSTPKEIEHHQSAASQTIDEMQAYYEVSKEQSLTLADKVAVEMSRRP
jgi:hypothetical protein